MKAVEKIGWFTLEAQVLFFLYSGKFVPWQVISLKAVPGCSRSNFLFVCFLFFFNPPGRSLGEHDQSMLCEIQKN